MHGSGLVGPSLICFAERTSGSYTATHIIDTTDNLTYTPSAAIGGVTTVRLQLIERDGSAGTNSLRLQGLQIFDGNGVNIAGQGTATSSSSGGGGGGSGGTSGGAGAATDGDPNTFFSSTGEADAWIEVTFDQPVTISGVSCVPLDGSEDFIFPSMLTLTTTETTEFGEGCKVL